MSNTRKILIVDDDAELREALVEQLALHDEFESIAVDNGTKGVQAAKAGQIDLVIEISHNTRPRVAGRGSAVFVHVARPDRSGTAGCVALDAKDLQRLLGRLGPNTRIDIA